MLRMISPTFLCSKTWLKLIFINQRYDIQLRIDYIIHVRVKNSNHFYVILSFNFVKNDIIHKYEILV